MIAAYECSGCLKETVDDSDVVSDGLVLADSICSAPGKGRHSWVVVSRKGTNSFDYYCVFFIKLLFCET